MSHPHVAHRSPNQKLGLVLFAIYFALYAGFIGVTVYDYKLLAREVFAGINLAIAYGMLLIIAAIVLLAAGCSAVLTGAASDAAGAAPGARPVGGDTGGP